MKRAAAVIAAVVGLLFACGFARAGGDAELEKIVAGMTLEEKLGQLMMPGVRGQEVTPELREQIQRDHLGGVIVFGGRNIVSRSQSVRFTNALQDAAVSAPGGGLPLLISIDQEGGVGSHLTMLTGGVDTTGNLALGADADVNDTYVSYSIMADDLRAFGIHMALAPVLDLLLNKDNAMNHIRSFGSDPVAVSERAAAAVRGLQENGVIACIKHYPGKGNTPVDSHKAAPDTKEDRATLEKTIFMPFRAAIDAGADSVMLNHEVYDAIEPGVVGTVSEKMISGLLRGDMKFRGLVITDSITMGGIRGTMTTDEAAFLSIKYGTDMILYAGNDPKDYRSAIALLKKKVESGELPVSRVDDAVMHVLAAKKKYGVLERRPPTDNETYRARKKANQEKSLEIARRTITVIKNDGVLPLERARASRVLVVSPGSVFSVPMMESLFPVGTSLAERVKKHAPGVRSMIYDMSSLERDMERAVLLAGDADVVVFGSVHAWWSDDIVSFVKKLEGTGKKVVVVGLTAPYDYERFPEVNAFVAAYCPRSVSLDAAIEVLFGDIPARGVMPVK